MNINLDNYEQFLLMYVDNELSAAERLEVDGFLRDYPFLLQELEVLQQTILPAENILFDKTGLLKPELDENMQEKLLLHLDSELATEELSPLQQLLQNDRLLQNEWSVLQRTKLDASELVLHPDKESLYRKERVRVISFVRWAAAAMLIGAGLYGGFLLLDKKDKPDNIEIAVNGPATDTQTDPVQKSTGGNDSKDPKENIALVNSPTDEEKTFIPDTTQGTGIPEKIITGQPVKNNMVAANDPVKKDSEDNLQKAPLKNRTEQDVAMTDTKPVNKKQQSDPKEFPERVYEKSLRSNNDIAAVEKIKSTNQIDLPGQINHPSRAGLEKIDESSNSYARTASMAFDDNNQDQILMMEEENVSRSKAAIFLKKLKRNVERRTNIKPGKSLRIAGFEFAVK